MSTPPPIHRQASKLEDIDTLPIEINKTIWVPSTNPNNVWETATVMAIGDLKVTVRLNNGKILQVDRGLALPMNPRVTDDMTSLYFIHEAGVLYNLEERSKLEDQRPYTFMANVLIAVNPLRKMDDPNMRDIISSSQLIPHPYAVAEMAYQQMAYNASNEMPTNQSVVISGESGAGKTESSKIVLKHLTTRGIYGKKVKSNDFVTNVHLKSSTSIPGDSSLDSRLIEQNPILEAFGNAKTLRNHNSSRFGKFMKLQFTCDGNYKLAGAFVETYLLEKSRLVYQVDGERNFHIFYQLLRGCDCKDKYFLTIPEDYHYLNQSNCYVAENTNDKESFLDVIRGLTCIGINSEKQNIIFSILAGLLHLGNIEFAEEETPEGEAAIVAQTNLAENALISSASLLGVDKKFLLKVITEREIITKDETFTVRRNAQNSIYARDAIAKSIYGRLFDWIIQCVNLALGQDPSPLPSIGVLDIFGFESFQRNDFEQLLINYTNEVLQATFNNQVFISEMELYKREGITVTKIDWPDNRECVDLIAGKPNGILSILDNEAINPKPSDTKFLNILHRTHGKNNYFPKPHPKDMQEIFIVRHFAGCVSYTIGAFIDKNNDTIPRDMAELFLSSKHSIFLSLFENENITNNNYNKIKISQKVAKLKSVASKFNTQMNELVDTLDKTCCNFIRCVKPNALMKVGMFDSRYVVGQLRCQGIMQTAQVLKVGLPTRISYQELVTAYKQCMPMDAQMLFRLQSDATLITAILWAFQVPMDTYKLGISKLFFKAGKISLLDSILKINWAIEGPHIVKRMKLWLARRRWRVGLAKVLGQINFKKLYRKILYRSNAIKMIQLWWRGKRVEKVYKKKRHGIILIQKIYKGYKAKKNYKIYKHEMIALVAKRAEEARIQAEEAKKKEEYARKIAEEARKESERKAAEADQRYIMEMEAKKAEEEAIMLSKAAAIAIKEAEEAAKIAALAVQNERLAEERAIKEAKELEIKIEKEREEAEIRKKIALAEASQVSDSLLDGLGHLNKNINKSSVVVVDVPPDMNISRENREQLNQLNELLKTGSISQSEYDELVPFLLQIDDSINNNRNNTNNPIQGNDSLETFYSNITYGIQIRCPACGISNNTANGNHCTECGSNLTTEDMDTNDSNHINNNTNNRAMNHQYYGYRTRSMSMQDLNLNDINDSINNDLNDNDNYKLNAPGTFKLMPDGQSILIHDGYFQCSMHGTQVLADENYAEYTVYVLKCSWIPCELKTNEQIELPYWLVSHRFSVFERLHKDLKNKIPVTIAILPEFPKKHVLGGVFAGRTGNSNNIVTERKQGLDNYIKQVIDICARLPDTLTVPELDRFLNLSKEVKRIKKKLILKTSNPSTSHNHPNNTNNNNSNIPNISSNTNVNTNSNGKVPIPLEEYELTQAEKAVYNLNMAIRNATGDLRRNPTVQQLVKICISFQPRVQISASLDNPFADMELIPRAMQCQEDLETTIGLYNDSLMAVNETYAISEGVPPAPYVPGQNGRY